MSQVQVMARLLNDNAPTVEAVDLGEIVAFNCPDYAYAMRVRTVFELHGNGMIEQVAGIIGATRIKYFIKG